MRLEDYLSQKAEARPYAKGAVIIAQGQEAKEIYVVKSGRVSVFRTGGKGESVIAHLGEGEIFGEMAVLRFNEHTLSVRAAEDTELYVIAPDLVHAELAKAHPLLVKILHTLLDRVKEANEVLIDLEQAGA